jgi:protein gp37
MAVPVSAPGSFWTHIWLGVTAENQGQADVRIPALLATPAAHRWVSVEPMLGPIHVDDISDGAGGVVKPLVGLHWVPGHDGAGRPGMVLSGGKGPRIDLVIAGGESGPGARPCHPDWVRSLRDQCAAAAVPFVFKQWGRWVPYDEKAPLSTRASGKWDGHYFGDGQEMNTCPLQRKAAGRLLDGREHAELPW